MENNKIYKNNFVEKIVKSNIRILKKNPPTEEDIKNFKNNKSSFKIKTDILDKYNIDIFYRLNNIIDTLNDLDNIPIFLGKYSCFENLKKNKITKTVYIIYHLEVYFIKMASLRDKLRLLVNEVYELGLSGRDTSLDILSRMKQLKGSEIIKLLKLFDKKLEKIGIIEGRNLVAHATKYDDEYLSLMMRLEMVEDQIEGIKDISDAMNKKYIQEKTEIIKENKKFIEDFIGLFFNEIEKEYDIKSINKK